MVTSAAQELAGLLLRMNEVPIEHGAMALFEFIAGGSPLTAEVSIDPAGQLSQEERALLGTPVPSDVHHREELLRCATGLSVASITVLVVTSRVPEPARRSLGIIPARDVHTTAPHERQAQAPLSCALCGLDITREQLSATANSRHLGEADSEEVVVVSVARLWTPFGWPLALVTERIYAQFLAVYPPPWPLPSEIPCARRASRRA